LSFPQENGAHAGPGPEETHAFALLGSSVYLPSRTHGYLRPLDLRRAAFHAMGRAPLHVGKRPARPRAKPNTLRVMTYNVHSCVGMDGRVSPARVARLIAHYDPDIVALQEVDVRRARTGDVDQAHYIARELEMDFHFHPAFQVEEERYGDAVLSRHPVRLVRAECLPQLPDVLHREPRGALWVEIEAGGRMIQLVNTHLSLSPRERQAQIDALLGAEWLAHPECRDPLVLCGDLNAMPRSRAYRRLALRLRDAQTLMENHRPKQTWFSQYPLSRIDHVFVGENLEVVRIEVPRTELARKASDHLPLIVDLRIVE
jgi:endonuclease/exonuclease/phosphatase family metal-dependent hydrolase